MNYKFISIILFNIISSNIFSQSCIEKKISNFYFLNQNIKSDYFYDNNFLLKKLFQEQNLCDKIDKIKYIYFSRFQLSGYSFETSPISYRIYFFDKRYNLISWYSGKEKNYNYRLKTNFSIQINNEVDKLDLKYIKRILKQVSRNNITDIEKEQNEINSGCNCINYESVYQIKSDITKVYFFDLYFKKLFNGDFMNEEEKKMFEEELDLLR